MRFHLVRQGPDKPFVTVEYSVMCAVPFAGRETRRPQVEHGFDLVAVKLSLAIYVHLAPFSGQVDDQVGRLGPVTAIQEESCLHWDDARENLISSRARVGVVLHGHFGVDIIDRSLDCVC